MLRAVRCATDVLLTTSLSVDDEGESCVVDPFGALDREPPQVPRHAHMPSYAAYSLKELIAADRFLDVVIVRALTAPAGAGKRSIVQTACRSANAVSVRLSATDNKLLAAFAELCAHDVALFDPKKERWFRRDVGRGVTQAPSARTLQRLCEGCRVSNHGTHSGAHQISRCVECACRPPLSFLLLCRRGPQEIDNR